MNSKPPLAVWAPMPPIQSGVADSTLETLMELRQFYEIEIFIDEGYQAAPQVTDVFRVYPFTEYELRHQTRHFAATLHEFGNSVLHFYQYFAMQRQENVIVSLHDLAWANTLFNVLATQGKYAELRQEIAAIVTPVVLAEYDAALLRLSQADAIPMQQFLKNHSLLENVIACSEAQIIRLDHIDEILTLYPDANLYRIPHVPKPLQLDSGTARQRLGFQPHTFLVGVLGYVARTKRIEKVIAAFREFCQTHLHSQLVIVGPAYEDAYLAELQKLIAPIADHVTITGFAEQADYENYLAACDVIIGLRWPWTGEGSRVVNQALNLGKPIIITDIPKWSHYPSEFTWRVPIDEHEIPMIVDALTQLADAPQLLAAASESARRWLDGDNRFADMIATYRKVIDGVISG